MTYEQLTQLAARVGVLYIVLVCVSAVRRFGAALYGKYSAQ